MSNHDEPRIPRSIIDSGIIALIIISIGFSGYMINQALEIQTKTDKKIDNFVVKWEQRIKISNTINNGTRDVIKDEISNLVNNLSAHRMITNATFKEVKQIENHTNELIQNFNATNEQKRIEAVKNITTAIEVNQNITQENNKIIKDIAKALNVTIDSDIKTANTTENLKELLSEILNKGR